MIVVAPPHFVVHPPSRCLLSTDRVVSCQPPLYSFLSLTCSPTSQTTSQDVLAFYLAQIYQLQLEAALDTGNLNVPSQQTPPVVTLAPRIPHFLYLSNLTSSLSSAVLATLVHVQNRNTGHSDHSRARNQAYVSREGSQSAHRGRTGIPGYRVGSTSVRPHG